MWPGTAISSVVTIPYTFQSPFTDILRLIFTTAFKIINDVYALYMFPVWFPPPNKPAKFPQILNYISAFYKEAIVKFPFFSPLPANASLPIFCF